MSYDDYLGFRNVLSNLDSVEKALKMVANNHTVSKAQFIGVIHAVLGFLFPRHLVLLFLFSRFFLTGVELNRLQVQVLFHIFNSPKALGMMDVDNFIKTVSDIPGIHVGLVEEGEIPK